MRRDPNSDFAFVAEAIDLIQATAVDASGAEEKIAVVNLPEPDSSYAIVKADGSYEKIRPGRKSFEHTLLSIRELPKLLAYYEGWVDAAMLTPAVWYSPKGVILRFQAGDAHHSERDAAVIKFPCTPAWDRLVAIADKHFDHKAFIRLIRVELWECLKDEPERFLNALRVLNFDTQRSTSSVVAKNRESLGNSVNSQVKAEIELPDELLFRVRIYRDPALAGTHDVRCALYVDPEQARFTLTPFMFDLDNAMDAEMKALGEQLTEIVKCPVIYGTP